MKGGGKPAVGFYLIALVRLTGKISKKKKKKETLLNIVKVNGCGWCVWS